MRKNLRYILYSFAAVAIPVMWKLLETGIVFAHDCSSEGDCLQTAGYNAVTSIGGGIIAILAAILGSHFAGLSGTAATETLIPPDTGTTGAEAPTEPTVMDADGNPLVGWDPKYPPGKNGYTGKPGDVWDGDNWVSPEQARKDIQELVQERQQREREMEQRAKDDKEWIHQQTVEGARRDQLEADRERAEHQEQKDAWDTLERLGHIADKNKYDDISDRAYNNALNPDGSVNIEYVEKLKEILGNRIGRDMNAPDEKDQPGWFQEGLENTIDDARHNAGIRIGMGILTSGSSEVFYQSQSAYEAMEKAYHQAEKEGREGQLGFSDMLFTGGKQLAKENLPVNLIETCMDPNATTTDILGATAMDLFATMNTAETLQNLKGSYNMIKGGGGVMNALTHRADPIKFFPGEEPEVSAGGHETTSGSGEMEGGGTRATEEGRTTRATEESRGTRAQEEGGGSRTTEEAGGTKAEGGSTRAAEETGGARASEEAGGTKAEGSGTRATEESGGTKASEEAGGTKSEGSTTRAAEEPGGPKAEEGAGAKPHEEGSGTRSAEEPKGTKPQEEGAGSKTHEEGGTKSTEKPEGSKPNEEGAGTKQHEEGGTKSTDKPEGSKAGEHEGKGPGEAEAPRNINDLPPGTEVKPHEAGIPDENARGMQQVSEKYNHDIEIRQTNPHSTPKLEQGFPPKDAHIKNKCGTEMDELIGAPPGHKGEAMHFAPELPPGKKFSDLSPEMQSRYNQRFEEYAVQGPKLHELEAKGLIKVKDGVIYNTGLNPDPKMMNKPFVGDHDIFKITPRDGSKLTAEMEAKITQELGQYGNGGHGSHMSEGWNPQNPLEIDGRAGIANKHLPTSEGGGGEALIKFSPNKPPVTSFANPQEVGSLKQAPGLRDAEWFDQAKGEWTR